ncbi:ankyrin repeat domain-containing protein [Endozoicomonas sp. SESOKO1]|uniref:ankyrin repeat domain-containing protein n=1 Tax=Endozoicomonas sp. SESOKO1 TaxID=2828742 RepID=UPI0021493A49
MESVNAAATDQQFECRICFESLAGKFNDFVVTACCKELQHTPCLEAWKQEPESLRGRDACVVPVKPSHTFLRCGLCRQNALPFVTVSTLVYGSSNSNNYCKPELAEYLRQCIDCGSEQAGGSGNDQGGPEASRNRKTVTMASGSTSPGNGESSRGSGDNVPDLPTLVRQGLKRSSKDLQVGVQEPLPVQACIVGDEAMLQEIANQQPETVHNTQEGVIYTRPVPLVTVAAENNHESCVKKLAVDSHDMFSISVHLALEQEDHRTLATLVRCDADGLTRLRLAEAIEHQDSPAAEMLLAAGVDINTVVMDVVENYRSPEAINFLHQSGVSLGEIVFMAAQADNRKLFDDLQKLPALRRITEHAHYVEATILAAQQENHVVLQALADADVVALEYALCTCVDEQNEAAIAALLKAGACYADALSLAASDDNQDVFVKLLFKDDCGHYLRFAAQNGDLALVKALLNAGVDASGGDEHADTPLAIAARNGHAAVVNLLSGALEPDRRISFIAQSIRWGTEAELRSLLATCKNAGQMFSEIQRVIHYALDHRDYGEPAIRQLLDKIDAGQTAMILSGSINNNNFRMLAALLAAGADANTIAPDGSPLLHLAVASGELQLVQLLLERGAAADLLNPVGETALSVAVAKGHKSMADMLVKATGAVDIETEVAAAAGREDIDLLRQLLCVADLGGKKFRQLLHQAAVRKQSQVVSVFAMQSTISAEIAFAMALHRNELAVVAEFLKAGIGKNRYCSASYLLMAAVRREEEKVKTLIDHGFDAHGDIKFAARAGETEALTVMLSAFTDTGVRNRHVEALIFNEVNDQSVLASLVAVERDGGAAGLRTFLFSILSECKQARTALERAQTRRQTIVAGDYLEVYPAMDRQVSLQRAGEEPTMHDSLIKSCDDAINENRAFLEKNEGVIQSLIRAGAEVDITDDNGVSFLSQAIQGNCQDIVRSILDCWKGSGQALNNPDAPNQQPDAYINRDFSGTLTDALVLAIGLDRQGMVTLLLDTVHGMKNVEFDRCRLSGHGNLLYDVANMGNIRLLGELWQLGARATPSLERIVQDADINKLQRFVEAGIKLDAADVGSEVHPLLLAATLYADSDNLQVMRSMVSITDNIDEVIGNQALTTQRKALSQLWQVVAEQHERIMNMLVHAADGENHRLFETLAGDRAMAGQLGRCLSDAAHHGQRKVVSKLLDIDVDINDVDSTVFLCDIALKHPDMAIMMVDYWRGKANRNCPVLIKGAINLAKQKLMEQPGADRLQTEQACACLTRLLSRFTVPGSIDRRI